jgi:hypothetical protein
MTKKQLHLFLALKFKEITIPVLIIIGVCIYQWLWHTQIVYWAKISHTHYTSIGCCGGKMYNSHDVFAFHILFIVVHGILFVIGVGIWEWVKSNIKLTDRILKVREAGHKFELNWIGKRK